jgi:hypothetical protein
MAIFFGKKYHKIKLKKLFLLLLLIPLTFFVGFSILTGKVSEYGVGDTLFTYATGGYGYLDALIFENEPKDFIPVRLGYWFAKLIELVGFDLQIPNQVLPFKYVPFLTNVGTFLEPIYSDGGLPFVLALVPLIVIGMDRLALSMYARSTHFGLLIWGNIVFFSMVSFFVPKFNQLPIWLFILMALVADKQYGKRNDR